MPYRNPFASSGNNRLRQPGPIYGNAMNATAKEQTKPLVTGGSLNDPTNLRLDLLEEQQQHPVDSTSVLQLANTCSLPNIPSMGRTYPLSLHSPCRSSSAGGSNCEDFGDKRDDAVAAKKEDWNNCRQKSLIAKSDEDLNQESGKGEGERSTAQQQTPVVNKVNSIFLQPSGSMMPNIPIMPMMQFIGPTGGSPDIPCPTYNTSDNFKPNYDNTLSGCMAAKALSDSTDPKNMANNRGSEPLASHIRNEEVLVPGDVNGNRCSDGAGKPDRCMRPEIQSNPSQTSTVHKSLTDCSEEAAKSVKSGDICQDQKKDGEFVNQSISAATHNADTKKT